MSDFNFPEEWVRTQLGDVLEYGKCEKAEPSSINDDAWVLELEDIERDSSKVIQLLTFADRQSKSTKNKFKKGDVLYGKLRPYLNKVVVAHSDGVCTTEIIPLNGGKFLNNKYIFYWLKTAEFLTYVTAVGYGVNMPRLGTEDGKAAPFVLAPLAEQQQIAQKLDELLAQVDTLKTRLDAIPKILKRFRQSVLAAAVSGRLTEEWRDNYKRVSRPENKKNSSFEIDENILKVYEIPSSWSWMALGNYAECSRGRFSVRPRNDPSCFNGKHPFIQIGDLPRDGGFIVSHQQTLNEKGLSISKKFDVGTTVIAIVGATIGNTGIVTYPVCFPDSLVGINSFSLDDNKYIDYYLRVNKESIRTASYAGGGQPNIKLTILNPLPIPVPPKEEILEIVRRVEQLFAYAEQIEQRVKDAQARVNHLTQSILAKAFRGELTADWRAQNPELISGGNSAAALLERIRVAREVTGKTKRKVKA